MGYNTKMYLSKKGWQSTMTALELWNLVLCPKYQKKLFMNSSLILLKGIWCGYLLLC